MQLTGVDRRRGSGGSPASCGCPRAGVPDDDVAAAVLAGRDDALEVDVLERVVLDVERGPAHGRVERRPFGTAQLTSTPSISSRKS